MSSAERRQSTPERIRQMVDEEGRCLAMVCIALDIPYWLGKRGLQDGRNSQKAQRGQEAEKGAAR